MGIKTLIAVDNIWRKSIFLVFLTIFTFPKALSFHLNLEVFYTQILNVGVNERRSVAYTPLMLSIQTLLYIVYARVLSFWSYIYTYCMVGSGVEQKKYHYRYFGRGSVAYTH